MGLTAVTTVLMNIPSLVECYAESTGNDLQIF